MTGDRSVILRIGQLFPRGQRRDNRAQDGRHCCRCHTVQQSSRVVVIHLGLVSILQHLVEVKGINVNDCRDSWSSFDCDGRFHLDDLSCFEYLLSIEGINVGSNCSATHPNATVIKVGVLLVLSEISPVQTFRALVEHPTFDPAMDGISALFLIFYDEDGEIDTKNELIRILMRVGVDPSRTGTDPISRPNDVNLNLNQLILYNTQ